MSMTYSLEGVERLARHRWQVSIRFNGSPIEMTWQTADRHPQVLKRAEALVARLNRELNENGSRPTRISWNAEL